MIKCICGKEFETEQSVRKHGANCKSYQDDIFSFLSKDFLIEMYEEKRYSTEHVLNEILKDKPRINRGHINKQLKKFGIKIPSVKDSSNSKHVRNKYKQTCIERYGAENALSYGTEIFHKRNKTVEKKYGVKNVFQDNDVKKKIKKTIFEKYGVDSPTKILGTRKNFGRKSRVHITVEKWLDENQIKFDSEKIENRLRLYNEDLGRFYQPRPDIIIKELNLIIEIYGNRWHANPKMYNDNDLIYTWMGEKTAKEIRNNNKIREKHINAAGYKVFVLWEYDIKNNASSNIKEKLLEETIKWKKLKLQKSKKLNPKLDTIYL